MKLLLEPAGREALRVFARPDTLIGLDYDGTLAPIAARPADAHMRAETRELLARLCRRFPVVILTGRARADVLGFLGGTGPLEVIGSHGLETFGATVGRSAGRIARWRQALVQRVGSMAGIDIEDKRLSLAVHYRRAPDGDAAQRRVEEAVADLPGARILGGKKVVNIVPSEAPDKGAALLAACKRAGCQRAIYVGDDDTDEDVFRLARPEQVLTVRVGLRPESAAAYFLADQGDIDVLLRTLLEAEPTGRGAGATG